MLEDPGKDEKIKITLRFKGKYRKNKNLLYVHDEEDFNCKDVM
jgi:hypothetical protein